ncbi:Uncharacterised protein [Bordetella pertussis]|nr:Uncharacterised protein [Bordetella pertussis]CFP67694.1 Uncharacterised protein [Bordetella pertussis]CFW39381.1 Uncharacterised protein [Bordetella pertussis]
MRTCGDGSPSSTRSSNTDNGMDAAWNRCPWV